MIYVTSYKKRKLILFANTFFNFVTCIFMFCDVCNCSFSALPYPISLKSIPRAALDYDIILRCKIKNIPFFRDSLTVYDINLSFN